MLLKWLITATIIYFIYKRYFALPLPEKKDRHISQNKPNPTSKEKDSDEGEYIDYEEVD